MANFGTSGRDTNYLPPASTRQIVIKTHQVSYSNSLNKRKEVIEGMEEMGAKLKLTKHAFMRIVFLPSLL